MNQREKEETGRDLINKMNDGPFTLEQVYDRQRPRVPMGVRQAKLERWRERVEVAFGS